MTTTTTPPTLDPTCWRSALVYGLGISGRAALRLLTAGGVAVMGVDDRDAGELELSDLGSPEALWLLLGEEVPAQLPPEVDAVVVSPGVPPERPLLEDARRRGVPVVSEVELAFHYARGPVVGITGSNGKSTTTALAGALLETAGHTVSVCGNIGHPFAAAVMEPGPAERIFVVELSSFQLEHLHDFHPRAAAWLNLAPDHMNRYRDLAEYAAAKQSLLDCLEAGDTAVLNFDDPHVAKAPTRGRRRFFSRRGRVADGCWLDGDRVLEADPETGEATELFRRGDVPLAGEHNLENAMAAALLARAAAEVPPEALRRGLAGFAGLPHRMQKVGEIGGVVYFDDSKGTNPAATVRSLEGLPDGRVHLILGGQGKGADFGELAPWVRRKARRLYLVGEAAAELETVLADTAPAERTGTLERAVGSAAEHAGAGEVVLLSPACASFDQFRNFAHRGERFQQLVAEAAGRAGQADPQDPQNRHLAARQEEGADGEKARV
jgi:UDP-N-acetylmuramoylalanine--D-glutamate ligase